MLLAVYVPLYCALIMPLWLSVLLLLLSLLLLLLLVVVAAAAVAL